MNLTAFHAKYFAFELTKRNSSASVQKLASSLMNAQVDLNPHQVDSALFAFKSPHHPDFFVETNDALYLVETKKAADIESKDVQEKAKAALEYCKYATEFNVKNGGKCWKYVLIPHNVVFANMSFETLAKTYEFNDM